MTTVKTDCDHAETFNLNIQPQNYSVQLPDGTAFQGDAETPIPFMPGLSAPNGALLALQVCKTCHRVKGFRPRPIREIVEALANAE